MKNLRLNKKVLSFLVSLGLSYSIAQAKCYDNVNIKYIVNENKTSIKGHNKDISIFDIENNKTCQYGANQRDFDYRFEELISNPRIFEEVSKYFPIESFDSYDEALYFYKKYFEIIANCGCGYAAACNYAFRLFEGNNDEFEKIFGYPMYEIIENKIDFNYELFMLKFFNYYQLDILNNKDLIISTMSKDLANNKIKIFLSKEYSEKKTPDFSKLLDEEIEEWREYQKERDDKFHKLYVQWINAKNKYYNFGIPLDECFGYFESYLKKNNIDVDIDCIKIVYNYNIDDIIASDNFTFYHYNENNELALYQSHIDNHYFYISEVTDDGLIICSSWGNRYIFDDKQSSYVSKILVKSN